jgi:hypothetical protein
MEKYGPAQLQLIDIQGHIRYQSQITVNKGRNFRTLDINNLPTGVYFLRVQSLEGSQVSKILVNR